MARKGNQAVRTVSFMMLITLLGKLLGMVREQFLAAKYATGVEGAAFMAASQVPRLFFDAIFASAISASFIPIFVEYLEKRGRKEAFALANRFITLISTVTVCLMLLGMLFAEPITRLFVPGYEVETIALCIPLLRMLFPTMLFTAIAFSFVGILQSLDEFNIPAALSVVSNTIIIIYYIFFNDRLGVYGLTAAFLLGWAMQAFMQLPSLWKKDYHFRPDFRFRDDGLRRIGKLMLPVMVSTWIQPINFVINSRFASLLPNGEQNGTALQYANTLYTIIVGVFVLAIANIIFPQLSRMTGEEGKEEFGKTVKVTLRSMMFLLIPMMAGLMVLAEPVVRLIYQRGQFQAEDTLLTSTALFFFSVGMAGYGVQTILSRAFYANQDGKMPFLSGVVSISVNWILCSILLEPMGLGGLALAAALSTTAAAAVLFVPAVRKYPGILDGSLVSQLTKMLAAAMGMVALVLGSYRFFAARLGGSLLMQVFSLGVAVCIGVAVYMMLAWVLRIEEGRMVFETLGRLMGRGAEAEASADGKNRGRREYPMIEKISWAIEDSFCFRVLAKIINGLVSIWTGSLIYRCYAAIGRAVGRAFAESAILGFFRRNWDNALRVRDGHLPRFWRRLSNWSGRAVRLQTNAVADALRESALLGLFGRNFMVLCLCVIVLSIPILPTILLAAECMGTFLLYLVNIFMGRIRAQRTSMVCVLLGCFGVAVLYGGLTSYAFPQALQAMAILLTLLAVCFVAKDVIDTEEKLDFVLFMLIGMGALVALYAVYQYVVGVEMDEAWVDAESFNIATRAYATFNNPNVLGEYLIIVASLAAGMLWKVRNWLGKLFYAGCFTVLCLGLLATNSRGAMLGLLFSAGLFVLLAERRLLPVGIAGLAAMPFVLPASLWSRLASSLAMSDSSSLYRLSIYKASGEIIQHYWATGIGIGAFPQIYPLFSFEAANAYHAHNLFLEEFIELGIVGFVLLLLLLVFFFQRLYSAMGKTPRRFKVLLGAMFGGFAGLLLQGMTDHLWFDYRIVLLFWCFIGISMAAVRVGENEWRREKR